MKKYLVLAMVLASILPAAAQSIASQLDVWVSTIVEKRFKKEWTPKLYAAPATAAQLGTVGGIAVTSDPAMKEKALQLRNVEAFPDIDQFTRQPITVPANSVMAEQSW